MATEGDNAFSAGVIGSLVRQIASLQGAARDPEARAEGRSFIIVSSGAIALGLNRMGMETGPGSSTSCRRPPPWARAG